VRLGFGGCRTLFVHEWDVVGREDSRDVADHDACSALNRLLRLVVYPRKDRRARLRRVVIRSVIAGKRAGVTVPTLAARNSQTKGSVAQEWDAVDEVLVAPGSNRLASGVQLDPTPDVVHIGNHRAGRPHERDGNRVADVFPVTLLVEMVAVHPRAG